MSIGGYFFPDTVYMRRVRYRLLLCGCPN